MSVDKSPKCLKQCPGTAERLPSTPCRSLSSLLEGTRNSPFLSTSASKQSAQHRDASTAGPACRESAEPDEIRTAGSARKGRTKPDGACPAGIIGAASANPKASARSVAKRPRSGARKSLVDSSPQTSSFKDDARQGRRTKRGDQEQTKRTAEKMPVGTPSPLSSERAIKKLRASATRVQEKHLAMQDQGERAGTTTVLAEEFMKKSPRRDGRPQRARFPVLNEGERLVFQRVSGSLTPTVVGLEKAESIPKLEAKKRQSSCPAKEPKSRPSKAPAAFCQPLPADQPRASGEQESALPPNPLPPPKRSCLKKESSKRRRTGRVLKFKDNPKEVEIENFSHLKGLWADSCAVECGKCQLAFPFGPGIKMEGEPDRSHFAQNDVICPNCITSQTYEEIGAWLVVALASRCTAAAQGSSASLEGIAQGPVTTLIDSLAAIGNLSRPDKLADLLGGEAAEPEARREILSKAQSMVEGVLGSAANEDDPDQAEAEETEGSDGEAGEAEGQSPPEDCAAPSPSSVRSLTS